MSHKRYKCLKVQAMERFKAITCLGRSKHEDKLQAIREYEQITNPTMTKQEYVNNYIRNKIYSGETYATYEKHNNYFLEWCENTYKCKTLEQCREHVNEWLQNQIDKGLSAYTIKMEAAALGKLYQEPTTNFIKTPDRKRADITRSRNSVVRDNDFSIENNREIIEFCRATGLRRSELESLTGSQLIEKSDGYYLAIKGKGGRYREAPIIGDHIEEIVARIKSKGPNDRVWDRVPNHMDVHSYRSEYATAIYKANARPIEQIPYDKINHGIKQRYQSEVYHCKNDRRGKAFDRRAMLLASRALGHNRIDVVAEHYIR